MSTQHFNSKIQYRKVQVYLDYSGCYELRKVPGISDQNRSHFQSKHVRKHRKLPRNVKTQNERLRFSTDQMCPIDQENDMKHILDVLRNTLFCFKFFDSRKFPMFTNMLNLKMTAILIKDFRNLSQFVTSRTVIPKVVNIDPQGSMETYKGSTRVKI